jgi:signal transduction histidine kinase
VKSHSHLGEAPVQEVDIHAGLDSTLALFRHKLGAITVRRDYGELPKIVAYGSELNQVWTNLIDNALHAMGATGELALVTRRDGERVIVEVIDSGPGIPPEIQLEIWKPFFTTKGVGEGTGLGLHLAHNVIVQRHRGTIEVDSKPGRTCFRVMLPI